MPGPELSANGVNGQIDLFANKICILRKGVLGFFIKCLKGDKEILISSITSLQFKKAGMMTNGYLKFSFMEGTDSNKDISQHTQDESTLLFNIKQQPAFEHLKDEINKRLRTQHTNPHDSTKSRPKP